MNQYERQVFELYENLNIGKSSACAECKKQNADLTMPVSIWQVGDAYYESSYKVLFVGKAARGTTGTKCGSFLDATETADKLYHSVGWAYWSYTKAIAEALYPENAWEKIAFTNMVKCNNSETVDTATSSMKEHCIPILKEEIKLLQPKNIIFYTNSSYDNQIEKLFDKITDSVSQEVAIGKKRMNVWRFKGVIEGCRCRVIRIGHPERMKKMDYVKFVTDFLKGVL